LQVKLADLLSEAVRLCEADLEARATGTSASDDENDDATMTADADTSADTSPEIDMAAVAKVVGLGAVKYADLAMNRESNYRFSYAKMLALNGNTAPYMLYAYARIQGIQRKAAATLAAEEAAKTTTSGNNDEIDVASQYAVTAQHPAEAALARQLLKLPEVVVKLEKDLYPNLLCDYLFETSQKCVEICSDKLPSQIGENCKLFKCKLILRSFLSLSLLNYSLSFLQPPY